MNATQLSLEQANLAFDLLDIMIKHFPENPELTVPALRLILESTEQAIKENEE